MTTFDITDTLAPTSDQLDAIELVAGPRIFTVDRVTAGNSEQPVQVYFSDFPRPWRPSKGMRRVLAACWGADASQWTGRKCKLYNDPDVMFGRDKTGGTRIAALSHIDAPQTIPVMVSRGKIKQFHVEVLTGPQLITDKQADDFLDTIHKAQDQAALSEIGKQLKAFDLGVYKVELQTAWSARSAELKQPVQGAIDNQEQAS